MFLFAIGPVPKSQENNAARKIRTVAAISNVQDNSQLNSVSSSSVTSRTKEVKLNILKSVNVMDSTTPAVNVVSQNAFVNTIDIPSSDSLFNIQSTIFNKLSSVINLTDLQFAQFHMRYGNYFFSSLFSVLT